MKFIKGTTKKKLVIPNTVMAMSGFERGGMVEIRALTDAVVILKKEMTAMELANAVDGLQRLAVELLAELAGVCGPCQDCGSGECPAAPDRTATVLPEEVRKDAGIPEGAKLRACPGEERGTVRVSQADYRYDLTDVPDWERSVLESLGVCLGDLKDLLMSEDIVYG